MKDTRNYFEKRKQKLEQDNSREHLAEKEIKTLQIFKEITNGKFLHSGSSVIDIGCGDQFMKNSFESIGVDYKGFDIDSLDIEKDRLPVADDSQDLIISYALIEHLSSPINMIEESFRCLKPGGTVVIGTPNWWYSSKHFFDDYTHIKPYSPNTLRNLLNDYGFKDIYDFPNLRCKSRFAYTNKYKYFLANARPFTGNPKFSFLIPNFLKGKSKGVFVLAKK